jgi:hypothetical protein
MSDRNQQYEVIFFQTDQNGSRVIAVNGMVLPSIHPVACEGGAIEFIKDLGLRRYCFKSQELVGDGARINWVFERML